MLINIDLSFFCHTLPLLFFLSIHHTRAGIHGETWRARSTLLFVLVDQCLNISEPFCNLRKILSLCRQSTQSEAHETYQWAIRDSLEKCSRFETSLSSSIMTVHKLDGHWNEVDRCDVQEQFVHWLEKLDGECQTSIGNERLKILVHLQGKLFNLGVLII